MLKPIRFIRNLFRKTEPLREFHKTICEEAVNHPEAWERVKPASDNTTLFKHRSIPLTVHVHRKTRERWFSDDEVEFTVIILSNSIQQYIIGESARKMSLALLLGAQTVDRDRQLAWEADVTARLDALDVERERQ